MVQYLKTKKGYFYKLKKNSQKKRISREEFNKKNKTRKNKKMIGGGRTEQEIIDELKTKGKWEEWIRLGRYFGQTSYTLGEEAEVFLHRPYMFYDVDGKIVNVSTTAKKYRLDVDNIAVFKPHIVKDPTNVEQSEYRIVDVSESLSTSGLATCTGLAIKIGTKKFMAHLDATTPIDPIISTINTTIDTEKIAADSLKPIISASNSIVVFAPFT
jgi:hypothetical protein